MRKNGSLLISKRCCGHMIKSSSKQSTWVWRLRSYSKIVCLLAKSRLVFGCRQVWDSFFYLLPKGRSNLPWILVFSKYRQGKRSCCRTACRMPFARLTLLVVGSNKSLCMLTSITNGENRCWSVGSTCYGRTACLILAETISARRGCTNGR